MAFRPWVQGKLERAVDGAPFQTPTLKFLTPQAPRSPTPGHDLGSRMKILFNMFSLLFVRTHTKFGIKIFEINVLMIFDLLTSPQRHQFDPRMKNVTCILFCSSFPNLYIHNIAPIPTKVRNRAKIRNQYNQAPHLTQDTNGKVTASQLDIMNESQGVNPFPAGDHQASINRREQKYRNIWPTKEAPPWNGQ